MGLEGMKVIAEGIQKEGRQPKDTTAGQRSIEPRPRSGIDPHTLPLLPLGWGT